MNRKRFFSPAEWEILQYISEHHPITAREVADHFGETRQWARTTVLTMLDRLRDKGYVTRDDSGAVHLFSPSAPRSDLMSSVVRDFVHKALGGSLSPFMAYLGSEAKLSATEIEELKRIVQALDEQKEAGHE
jgi:predicted transcriptional regulator